MAVDMGYCKIVRRNKPITPSIKQERTMAVGWARDGAVQDQIDASVADAVKQARNRLPEGEGSAHCVECDTAIPEARRKAIPGVCLCVHCQSAIEKDARDLAGYNRRGNKDSQLR